MEKRLYRSRSDRILGGVAGGLAEYFDIDPVLVRILFVVALFVGGSGFLAYIICWLIIPERPVTAAAPNSPETPGSGPAPAPPTSSRRRGSVIGGLVLVVIGVLFLADNFIPRFHFEDFWPILLVAIGIGILVKSFQQTT